MGIETVNDVEINRLLLLPKRVSNPSSRQVDKVSHIQHNFRLTSDCGQQFNLYVRGSKQVENDFSCGLLWMMPSGESLTIGAIQRFQPYSPQQIGEDRNKPLMPYSQGNRAVHTGQVEA